MDFDRLHPAGDCRRAFRVDQERDEEETLGRLTGARDGSIASDDRSRGGVVACSFLQRAEMSDAGPIRILFLSSACGISRWFSVVVTHAAQALSRNLRLPDERARQRAGHGAASRAGV